MLLHLAGLLVVANVATPAAEPACAARKATAIALVVAENADKGLVDLFLTRLAAQCVSPTAAAPGENGEKVGEKLGEKPGEKPGAPLVLTVDVSVGEAHAGSPQVSMGKMKSFPVRASARLTRASDGAILVEEVAAGSLLGLDPARLSTGTSGSRDKLLSKVADAVARGVDAAAAPSGVTSSANTAAADPACDARRRAPIALAFDTDSDLRLTAPVVAALTMACAALIDVSASPDPSAAAREKGAGLLLHLGGRPGGPATRSEVQSTMLTRYSLTLSAHLTRTSDRTVLVDARETATVLARDLDHLAAWFPRDRLGKRSLAALEATIVTAIDAELAMSGKK